MGDQIQKPHILTRTWMVCILAFVACFFWGSAFPSVKTGYALLGIASDDTASTLLFAGIRFFLAGVLVILIGSIASGRFLKPKAASFKYVVILALFQTIIQYIFFYIGLAHASGVKSSIIEAASTFFAILVAVFLFKTETLTIKKVLGCILGFAGVVIININSGGFDSSMSFLGEGFILLSTIANALSVSFVKSFSRNEDPVTLSGYQFLLGGAVLSIVGYSMGGRISFPSVGSVLLLIYMAIISAAAYSIWSLLLKHNPVSKVSIFGFANPVIGVILSAIILGEHNQAFSLYGLASLVLVSIGIIVVYWKKKAES